MEEQKKPIELSRDKKPYLPPTVVRFPLGSLIRGSGGSQQFDVGVKGQYNP